MTNTNTKEVSPLINKKIKVAPIFRQGNLPEDHDGAIMFTGCRFETCLPRDTKRGQLVSILNKEEQAFFEKELDLEEGALSIYKKKDNFWFTFLIKADKEEVEWDLSDPLDNLKWRVAKANSMFAPSWAARYASGAYKFALVDEDIKTKAATEKTNERQNAYMHLGSIQNDAEKMANVLTVYGKKPSKNAKAIHLKNTLAELINDDATLPVLMTVFNDVHFEIKIFIDKAIAVKAILKEMTRYSLPGGDKIGGTLQEAIDYLQDPKNQDVYLKVQSQIDITK